MAFKVVFRTGDIAKPCFLVGAVAADVVICVVLPRCGSELAVFGAARVVVGAGFDTAGVRPDALSAPAAGVDDG